MASQAFRDATFVPQETRENFKDVIAKRPDLVKTLSGRIVPPVSGTTQLYAGQVMGQVTASGLFAPYASANTDGSQVPVGVLKADVLCDQYGNGSECVLIRGGAVYQGLLIGLDANAITALKAASYVEHGDQILEF